MSLIVDGVVSEGLLEGKSLKLGASIVTIAAGTLSLVAASEAVQVFQGSTSGQIVKMPDATTLQVGHMFWMHNDSTQNITVQDSASGALFLLGQSQRAKLVCTSVGSAAGAWSYEITTKNSGGKDDFMVSYPGTGLAVNFTGGAFRHNGTSTAVAGGTLTLPASTTGGWIYVDVDAVVKGTASLPNGATPLYQFTTTASAVSTLTDMREEYEANLVWGIAADIQPVRYNSAQGAGTSEKYARADHTHAHQGLLVKSNVIAAGSFTGSPRTATVTFTTVMPSVNYSVSVVGIDGRVWKIQSVATTGFVINSQANTALTGNVYWTAMLHGESL